VRSGERCIHLFTSYIDTYLPTRIDKQVIKKIPQTETAEPAQSIPFQINNQLPLLPELLPYRRAQIPTQPRHRLLHPDMVHVFLGQQIHLELLDPGRKDLQPLQRQHCDRLLAALPLALFPRGDFSLPDGDAPHGAQVVAVLGVEGVVVDEVAAAVEDEFAPVYLDPLHVVRRVAVDDVDAALVDEEVRQGADGALVRAPGVVGPPVHGEDLEGRGAVVAVVVLLLAGEEGLELRARGRRVVDEVEGRDDGPVARVVRGGEDVHRQAARVPPAVLAPGAGRGARGAREREHGGAERFVGALARPCEGDAGVAQRPHGLDEAVGAEVERVVVGQRGVVDARLAQGGHVGRVHAVVEGLVRPQRALRRHGRLEVDQVQVGRVEQRQRRAPGRAVRVLPQLGVRGHERGHDARLARVVDVLREQLVDQPPQHHVAHKVQLEGPHGRVGGGMSLGI